MITREIEFSNFKILASIGVLDSEHQNKQIIEINAKLFMGRQAIIPKSDFVHEVLDYRVVHKIIKTEVERQHTQLLETLAGKVCEKLFALPLVVGVAITISKPEIFPDCTVSVTTRKGITNE